MNKSSGSVFINIVDKLFDYLHSLFQTVIFFQSNPCFAVNREIYKYILLWVQLLNRVKHISDMFP